jgi:hypothetical protein
VQVLSKWPPLPLVTTALAAFAMGIWRVGDTKIRRGSCLRAATGTPARGELPIPHHPLTMCLSTHPSRYPNPSPGGAPPFLTTVTGIRRCHVQGQPPHLTCRTCATGKDILEKGRKSGRIRATPGMKENVSRPSPEAYRNLTQSHLFRRSLRLTPRAKSTGTTRAPWCARGNGGPSTRKCMTSYDFRSFGKLVNRRLSIYNDISDMISDARQKSEGPGEPPAAYYNHAPNTHPRRLGKQLSSPGT